VVDRLDSPLLPASWPWREVAAWVALKLLQGGGMNQGLLNNMRSFLWIRVQQFTTRELQVDLFRHLHSLSLRWHLARKTGEVLRVMDRGAGAVNSIMQYLVFSIIPTIIDIIIAIVYLSTTFNIWFGLIIAGTIAAYLASTVLVTEWRTSYRRKMNLADNKQRTLGVDSLLNAETVKYFSMETWEADRYRGAVVDYQAEEWKSSASLVLLNTVQSFVMNGGLVGIALYCAWLVSDG
jgi:ATP-binding cassette subfamily B (MDR/TAP) protein 6